MARTKQATRQETSQARRRRCRRSGLSYRIPRDSVLPSPSVEFLRNLRARIETDRLFASETLRFREVVLSFFLEDLFCPRRGRPQRRYRSKDHSPFRTFLRRLLVGWENSIGCPCCMPSEERLEHDGRSRTRRMKGRQASFRHLENPSFNLNTTEVLARVLFENERLALRASFLESTHIERRSPWRFDWKTEKLVWPDRIDPVRRLAKSLQLESVQTLKKRFWQPFTDFPVWRFGKMSLCWVIASRFFSGQLSFVSDERLFEGLRLERSEEEEEGESRILLHAKIGGIGLPDEILESCLLPLLANDDLTLQALLAVSRGWKRAIEMNWPRDVVITSRSLFMIPVRVLRNAKSLYLLGGYTVDRLRKRELAYVVKHLYPLRLESITTENLVSVKSFVGVMRESHKDFVGLRRFEVRGECDLVGRSDLDAMAPNLEEYVVPWDIRLRDATVPSWKGVAVLALLAFFVWMLFF